MSAAPVITDGEARDDWSWFGRGRRHYRLRRTTDGGGWIIRRRAGGVLLRVWTPSLPASLADSDEAIGPFWFSTAWPDLATGLRSKLIKRARQLERG
jgi:hypothetical protein